MKDFGIFLSDIFDQPFSFENFQKLTDTILPVEELFDTGTKLVEIDIPESFRDFIEDAFLLREYTDENYYHIRVLAVGLKRERSLESARTSQRNFIARYIKQHNLDGALVAFYVLGETSWRLSFIVRSYSLEHKKEYFTEPRRYSFLVGSHQQNYTVKKQFTELLSKIYTQGKRVDFDDLREVFSIEAVSEEFYDGLLNTHLVLLTNYLTKQYNLSLRKAEDIALQLINRLIFIFFIQKRQQWFRGIENNFLINVLIEQYKKWQQNHAPDLFYTNWLEPLFFDAFSRPFGQREGMFEMLPELIKKILTNAPYLNGGLFSRNHLDLDGLTFPDKILLDLIDFLSRFNFTIIENLPLDVNLAINPEVIGTIYEKFVSYRAEKSVSSQEKITQGIIYTQEDEMYYMSRQAVVHYLTNNTKVPGDLIYNFVYDEDLEVEKRIELASHFDELKQALDKVKIVDPACGSGSFLVKMVQLIYDLKHKLSQVDPEVTFNGYAVRKQLIEKNIYGVDVMEWAVRIAELRLWLFLIVESDLPPEKLLTKPLLPNLSFNLRSGDSLLEMVGDIDFAVVRKDLIRNEQFFDPTLKQQILNLIEEKDKFKNNLPGHKSYNEIRELQKNIFLRIINSKIDKIKKDIKNLGRKQLAVQANMFKDTTHERDLFEQQRKKQLKILNEQLDKWQAVRQNLEKKLPFVWDLEFIEVFWAEGRKGFDIVIGNPPYVRQEQIAPPTLNEDDFTPDQWRNEKKQYKDSLRNSITALWGERFKPDGKADLYVYFYFKALSLLQSDGVFAFITSNSWLDVAFGKSLQEFLLAQTKIYTINDNQVKRSFKHADVNTIIIFTSAPVSNTDDNLSHTMKFVMWRKPFDEAVNKQNLWQIHNTPAKITGSQLTDLAQNIVKSDDWRVFPILQRDLYCDGTENPAAQNCHRQKYIGNKWGGKFLRAPDIFFTILQKGKDKLVRLGDVAEVKFGIKTGANEFFYVEDLTGKVSEDQWERVQNPHNLSGFQQARDLGLRVVKPSRWGKNDRDYQLFLIEADCLRPVIKSPRELKTIVVREQDLKYKVFMCNKSKADLKDTFALDYIEWGQQQGFHRRPTTRSRKQWWEIPFLVGNLFWTKETNDRLSVFSSKCDTLCDCRLYYANGNEKLTFILNSSFYALISEVLSRSGLGEGAKSLMVYEINNFLILDPKVIEANATIEPNRHANSIFTELGFDKDKPVREQEPQPLPDRKALDDVVFDALGLTDQERREVYRAVAELVQNRLNKAKNV